MSILTDIWNFITGAAKKVTAALNYGKDVANEIKTITDSPLLDVVVKMTPTTLDDVALSYVRTGLAAFIKAMGWADKKLSDFNQDKDALASALTLISAKAAVLKAEVIKADLSIQQAISAAPVVYNPTIIK